MLLAVKTVKSDWCVSIRLLLVKKSVGLLLVKCLLCFLHKIKSMYSKEMSKNTFSLVLNFVRFNPGTLFGSN